METGQFMVDAESMVRHDEADESQIQQRVLGADQSPGVAVGLRPTAIGGIMCGEGGSDR